MRIKAYEILCDYYIDGDIITIGLSEMIRRLRVKPTIYSWGVDHNLGKVVEYNVSKGYRVMYRIVSRRLRYEEELSQVGISKTYSESESTLLYLNRSHQQMIESLSDDEFYSKFRQYGNDYTKQILGGKRK